MFSRLFDVSIQNEMMIDDHIHYFCYFTNNRPFSPWAMQYRGEPKVATPSGKSSELQTKQASINVEAGGEFSRFYFFARHLLMIGA